MDKHRRANLVDRCATVIITAGGIAVIGAVVLILALIFYVAFPLLKPPSAEQIALIALPESLRGETTVAVCVDEYLETAGVLTASGDFHFLLLDGGEMLGAQPIAAPATPGAAIRHVEGYGNLRYSIHWSDNSLSLIQVKFQSEFDGDGVRSIVPTVETNVALPAPADTESLWAVAREAEDGGLTRVDQTGPATLVVSRRVVESDIFGNETVSEETETVETDGAALTSLALDTYGTALYGGTEDGRLLRWSLDAGEAVTLTDDAPYNGSGNPIQKVGLVFGDISVAAVDSTGEYSTWFPVQDPERGTRALRRIHDLKPAEGPTRAIHQSRRNKMLLRLTDAGDILIDYPTNERRLLSLTPPSPVVHAGFNTRANGIVGLDGAGTLYAWSLDCPHPEVSLGTLFGKVWYEDYPEPDFTWQSSASTDDFEPKFSLVPLIFGSFKGTVYAMLFAVPLALLGAVYTSQFTSQRIRGVVKSTLEVMAAVPSVVIGFLIALWLAPIVEANVLAFICAVAVFPLCYAAFVVGCQPLRHLAAFKFLERGNEFVAMIPVTMGAGVCAWQLGGAIESFMFSGDFKAWLYAEHGARYDQRNCIIIAFGLGFAVIPIIFTIAEDALSNVPNSLKAASQALGATRWQTVWRVILPTASPGIFAGVIIGFGRAVGETMIVLMATGNTPIMDWSIFNGMRTLSANIAVEIPEAPVGGTLFRILFLSAVLLLVLTSILNTVAELIRQHLRNKYGLSQ